MLTQLRKDPEQLGEPIRNTRKSGGKIYVAIVENFAIHFAVFSREKTVLIYDFKTCGNFW